MWCWHRWGKWSAPAEAIVADHLHEMGAFALCQARTCERCGKVQTYRLPRLRSLKAEKAPLP